MTLRPTPSMFVALLALGIALGGSAVAASNLINGSKLRKYSVPGNRLKKNSLTGTEINEAKLGTVPNAAHARFADSATRATHAASADSALSASDAGHATSADKLGGLTASAFVEGGGQTFAASKTVPTGTTTGASAFDIPGLGTATLACSAGGNSTVQLRNDSGRAVDESDALAASGAAPVEGGDTVPSGGSMISVANSIGGQIHVMVLWPSGTADHVADFTIGWFRGTGCTAIVEGVSR